MSIDDLYDDTDDDDLDDDENDADEDDAFATAKRLFEVIGEAKKQGVHIEFLQSFLSDLGADSEAVTEAIDFGRREWDF